MTDPHCVILKTFSVESSKENMVITNVKFGLSYPPMGRFAVDVGGALTALLSGAFPTFETTDLLQDREATGRSLAAITRATVAMAARRGDTVGARALLDFGKGDLQAGQWVFSVFVPLSVVTVLVLKS